MNKFILLMLCVVLLVAPCTNADAKTKTGSTWNDGRLNFYDRSTFETLAPVGWPWTFYEEFMGSTFDKTVASEDTNGTWTAIETNLNAAVLLSADGVPGLLSMAFDSDVNAARAVIYFGDNESVSIDDGLMFETRLKVSVAPTLLTSVVIGLAGADNVDPDTIDSNCWFRIDTGANWKWESDDGTTDDDDNDAGVAVSTSAYVILRIDATESTVKFYINGAKVGTASMADLTSTTGKVQPYIAIGKCGGAGLGTLLVDYIRMWGVRE